MWIVFAFIPAVVDAYANIVDGHFSNTKFKDPWILIFYLGVLELLFVPLLFLYRLPVILPWQAASLFGVATFLDFLYLAFYLKALQKTDTSIIAALFSLGKITVPIMAFFVLHERLTWTQYIGFLVIITAAIALTTSRVQGRVHFNKAILFMSASSLVHAVQGVIYKRALENVDWVTGFVYVSVFATFFYFCIFVIKRRTVLGHFRAAPEQSRLLLLQSGLAFISGVTGTIAISLAPITLVKAVFATQPFFVLLYTPFLRRYTKLHIKEQMDKDHLFKKAVCFLAILVALVLVI